MTAVVNQGQDFSQVLADERIQTARLVSSFDTVASALGNRAADIQALTRSALATATAVSTRDRQLRATLATLPGFLRQGEVTAKRLGSFSVNATPVMSDLRVAAQALVPAMRDLGPAANAAQTTLATLERFAARRPADLHRLRPFADATRSFASPYSGLLQQLNPFVAYLRPVLAGDLDLVRQRRRRGPGRRPRRPPRSGDAADQPLELPDDHPGPEAQILAKLSGGLDTRGTNAYPLPGTSGQPQPRTTVVPPLQPDPPYVSRSLPR